MNGKSGLLVGKCLSQLSLTVPPPAYPRSSCSSSELSLSSACSEFSSGSYTWNEGHSCEKKVRPPYSTPTKTRGTHSLLEILITRTVLTRCQYEHINNPNTLAGAQLWYMLTSFVCLPNDSACLSVRVSGAV